MVQPSGNERVFLKDEAGNYYVQAAGMSEPVRVPNSHWGEVEEVVGGQDDTAGFVVLSATPQLQLGGLNLSVLGKCNGCQRTFGVLGRQP